MMAHHPNGPRLAAQDIERVPIKRRAIIIDDDVTVATVLEDIVTRCGVEVVALAHDYETGARLLINPRCDLAFVDLQLGKALSGVDLARRAVEAGVSTIVVTGSDRLPQTLTGAALLLKPFSTETVRLLPRYSLRPIVLVWAITYLAQ